MADECCFPIFLQCNVNGRDLMRFQRETSVFKSSDVLSKGPKLLKPEKWQLCSDQSVLKGDFQPVLCTLKSLFGFGVVSRKTLQNVKILQLLA